MRPEQLEAWVLSVVDMVAAGSKAEDSRLELKADWPDPQKAARRIAGHANASGGESILWVIGLDEIRGVVGTKPVDVAEWRSKLTAQFDGIEPSMVDLKVPTAKGALTALLFDTSRRPYVVKNLGHGTTSGDPVALEVPWRDGTRVRSARREDLLRLLVPLQSIPIVELLSASAWTRIELVPQPPYDAPDVVRVSQLKWEVALSLYLTPQRPEPLVFPTHKTSVELVHAGTPPMSASNIYFATAIGYFNTGSRDSVTVTTTETEAVFSGPGTLKVTAHYYEPVRPLSTNDALEIRVALKLAGTDRAVQIRASLRQDGASGEFQRDWKS